MSKYYQERLAKKQAQVKERASGLAHANAQEYSHILYEYECAFKDMYLTKKPDICWMHGRFYIGRKSYTKQEIQDKTRQLQAKLHEKELLNELPEQTLD